MNNSLLRQLFLGAFLCSSLTACLGFNDAKPKVAPLEGQRVSVLAAQPSLHPDADLQDDVVGLPWAQEASDWAQAGGNAAHALEHVSLPDKVTEVWTASIGKGAGGSRALLNTPVVADGKLFAVDASGDVTAISVASGERLWRTELTLQKKDARDFSGGVAYENGRVFVTTGTGEVFSLSAADGSSVWRADVGMPVRVAPAVEGGRVFVVSHNNHTFALSAETGSLLWTHAGVEENLTFMGGGAPAVANGVVVVPYTSGELFALRAQDGAFLWSESLSTMVGADPFSAMVAVGGAPVIHGDYVFAANHNGALTVFELASGRRMWSLKLSSTQMPWVAGDTVFIVTEAGDLAAVQRSTGKVRWVQKLEALLPEKMRADKAGLQWYGPLLAGGRLVLASHSGVALTLNPQNGEAIRVSELSDTVSVPPVSAGGALFFLTDDGKVTCYR